jgi:pyruvate/2-oxoglutarate/acetoin dehydrogenase E1 component
MNYKQSLTAAMSALAADPARLFIGYGLTHGRAAGTLAGVPAAQLLETPVAENLMTGLAIGAALRGRKPVVYFERADFVLNAMDAIVNHLDKIAGLSRGQFTPGVILRITVGNMQKPLFTGATHTQDVTYALRALVSFPVLTLHHADTIASTYALAAQATENGTPCAVIEYKDLW